MTHGHTEKMDITKERISFTFDQRDIHIGISFVRAATVCVSLRELPVLREADCKYRDHNNVESRKLRISLKFGEIDIYHFSNTVRQNRLIFLPTFF